MWRQIAAIRKKVRATISRRLGGTRPLHEGIDAVDWIAGFFPPTSASPYPPQILYPPRHTALNANAFISYSPPLASLLAPEGMGGNVKEGNDTQIRMPSGRRRGHQKGEREEKVRTKVAIESSKKQQLTSAFASAFAPGLGWLLAHRTSTVRLSPGAAELTAAVFFFGQ
ncbi:hypothetical protein niasHT_017507 [Heterodera trifolii]|uniref:Uncharacterized protein n=1 Tax=Heterodera trifolii TaxID=157864 RepID=A0ABD2L6A2_9BILA